MAEVAVPPSLSGSGRSEVQQMLSRFPQVALSFQRERILVRFFFFFFFFFFFEEQRVVYRLFASIRI